MQIIKESFGRTKKGEDAFLFTLTQGAVTAKITNYGAAVVSLLVPDKNEMKRDVVLGFDTLANYEKHDKYMGAVIGRYANRIENGTFTLDGRQYYLYKNNGNSSLHGGKEGFDKKIWNYRITEEGLLLTLVSPDGEEGYPGEVEVNVLYSLENGNSLKIDYHAQSDADTPLSLTNHSYFNLSGHKGGAESVLNTTVRLQADFYTVYNAEQLPTGEVAPVSGTPLDFTRPKRIGDEIDSSHSQTACGCGYDNNFILRGTIGNLRLGAEAWNSESGISINMYTTFPGMVFYTGNYLDNNFAGKENTMYEKRCGFCFEAGYYPNSLRHSNFPSPVLKQGKEFHHTTVYRFCVTDEQL